MGVVDLCRAVFLLGALWFLTFTAMIPFVSPQGDGGPVPWSGRLYMIAVSVAFTSILAAAFFSLGRREAREFFA